MFNKYACIFLPRQIMSFWGSGPRAGHSKICFNRILIILNQGYLRNSQFKRYTLTLLFVSLKAGNKPPEGKDHSLHLKVEGKKVPSLRSLYK